MKHFVAAFLLGLVLWGCSEDDPVQPFTGPGYTTASVSVRRTAWNYTSVPTPPAGKSLADVGRGRQLWFSPLTARFKDLNSWETSGNRGNDLVSVLEFIVAAETTPDGSEAWGGLVSVLSTDGYDASGLVYLDVWVNDRIPFARAAERRGTVFVDVGRVSEDAVWDPLVPPEPSNGQLDFEGELRSGNVVGIREDTGLDDRFSERNMGSDDSLVPESPREASRVGYGAFTAAEDPAGDDRVPEIDLRLPQTTVEERIAKLQGINGTERNERLDTEDLNGNQELDLLQGFRSYRIDLGESAHLDVSRDWNGETDPDNGWRLYRIPLADFSQEIGGYDPARVQHVRLWYGDLVPGEVRDLQFAFIGLVDAETPPLATIQ